MSRLLAPMPMRLTPPAAQTDGVARNSFIAILQACAARLVEAEVLTADHIFRIARDHSRIPHNVGAQDLLLRPGGFSVDMLNAQGGGRLHTILHRDLLVIVRTRMDLDKTGSDKDWLEKLVGGHLQLEEKVVDAFQDFTPVNIDNESMTVECIRLKSGAVPDKERLDEYDDWGNSVLTFDVGYYPPIDTSNCQ